jgi:hypothetical protein
LTPAQRKTWQAALNAARTAQKAGDLKSAIEHFDAAIAAFPDDPRALGERGWARFKQNDLKGAEADLMAALARSGDSRVRGSQLYNLGRVHEAAGRTDAAIASYRASLVARPHPAVRTRIETLTKAKLTALDIKPAVAIADVKTLCADEDANDPKSLECVEGETVAQLGAAKLRTYTVRNDIGSEQVHLVWTLPDGKQFVTRSVHGTYNPGAFGIMEETEFLRINAEGNTLVVHARSQRSDSDMGLNEMEIETGEHRTYCGLVNGAPHCTRSLFTLYNGERSVIHPDVDDGMESHDTWTHSWALAVALDGKTLRIGNTGGELPKGPAELVGNHPLPW